MSTPISESMNNEISDATAGLAVEAERPVTPPTAGAAGELGEPGVDGYDLDDPALYLNRELTGSTLTGACCTKRKTSARLCLNDSNSLRLSGPISTNS